MRFDVVTLFPELLEPFLQLGMVGRAVRAGHVTVRCRSPREFGLGNHRAVDDTPYGGGAGMVMRVDCVVACLESLDADAPGDVRARRVLLTPQGKPLDQPLLQALAQRPALMLICGRYEGFDERVREHVDEEISLGDFVLSGGEVAAMAIIDGCARLRPGVLNNPASLDRESHSLASRGLLEYPQYTRPAEFRGRQVPEILRSGNHAAIDGWREQQALQRTGRRRPDILSRSARDDDPAK